MTALDFKRLLEEEMKAVRGSSTSTERPNKLSEKCDANHITTNTEVDLPNTSLEFLNILMTPIGTISNLLYSPNAVNEQIENALSQYISWSTSLQPWRNLRNRKLQCWGNFPIHEDNMKVEDISTPLPSWIDVLIDGLVAAGVFSEDMRPDNVLINQYQPNEGILHHTDGPAYYDRVAILSLGSDTLLSFRRKLCSASIGIEYAGDVCSVLLQQRSLFVFEKEAYSMYMHGIADEEPVQAIDSHGVCVNIPPETSSIRSVRSLSEKIHE